MKKLIFRAILGLISLVAGTAIIIFCAAGSIHYTYAQNTIILFLLITLVFTINLGIFNPELLKRRIKLGPWAEKYQTQKNIQFLGMIVYINILVCCGIDFRWKISQLPEIFIIFGNLLIVIGLFINFIVMKTNPYSSGIIEVRTDQSVISKGLYKFVRHPMYSGTILILVGGPMALNSYLGLFASIPIFITIRLRLLDEEKILTERLEGYREYILFTPYRLIPLIW